MKKENLKRKNFNVFTFSNSLMSLAIGLFGPFYYLFISDMGGSIENFGIAAGLLILSGALFSLFVGKFSDKIGRKPFLVIGGFTTSIIVFLYTVIDATWQLYLLQIFSGIIATGFKTAESAYLGDLTDHNRRGEQIGRYNFVIGTFEALAIIAGGFLAGRFGFEIVFYIVAIISLISAFVMLKLKEK